MRYSLFDFTKSYSAGAVVEKTYVPAIVSFPFGKIQLLVTLIENETQTNFHKEDGVFGYIITEKGKWFFSSYNFFQTEFSYGKQVYLLEDFVVCESQDDYRTLKCETIKFEYDNLIYLDNFIKLDIEKNNIKINQDYEKIIFDEEGKGSLELKNEYNWHLKNDNYEYFKIKKHPYFLAKKNDGYINLKEVQELDKSISWFLKLVFNIKQSVISIQIDGLNSTEQQRGISTMHYYHKEIIKGYLNQGVESQTQVAFTIRDLSDKLTHNYSKWQDILSKKTTLLRLYFNEINSENYILDDRFKNLCSIIQGLEVFSFKRLSNSRFDGKPLRKGMLKILHASFNNDFLLLTSDYIENAEVERVLDIISDMRDYFQHLNKEIKIDLSNDSESMYCINRLLQINIRFHLLRLINITEEKIDHMIKRDLAFLQLSLFNLKTKLILPKNR
ncbi:hypothetical protein ASE74_09165 [Pedobacter sp. Leaf216]|uniref:hypothetical protein n=1 Tax=Pedobacter sp. Leaf216 TaxID=1735684 RepID=UPI0006FDD111|nr:hypothetical protein [Pedobacter sp. Leaf216]KQM66049.1 hypothetical protein ASE74_09165 [Pedobacter sp. Leaf216]